MSARTVKRPRPVDAPSPRTQKKEESLKARSEVTDGPTRAEIEEAAYRLWLSRGGNEVVNWLEAERTLRAEYRLRSSATESAH